MPLKKGSGKKGSELGRAIVRQAQKDSRIKRSAGLGFATADSLVDTEAPLQSVTDMTSLEEFLTHATMADKSFTAEKAHVFVRNSYDPNGQAARTTSAQATTSAAAASSLSLAAPGASSLESTVLRWLRIPRRPAWNEKMSAQELHELETATFLEWRRNLAALEAEVAAQVGGVSFGGTGIGSDGEASVTPFEKNLAIWQQLWRVVERSDVLIQIVDARDPLFYYCPDVDSYVKEVNPAKRSLILVNKADYLTAKQRKAWGAFLKSKGLDFVFFSAKSELTKMAEEDAMRKAGGASGALTVPGLRAPKAEGPVRDDDAEAQEEDDQDGEQAGDAAGKKGPSKKGLDDAVADALLAAGSNKRANKKKNKKAAANKGGSRFAALLEDDEDEEDGKKEETVRPAEESDSDDDDNASAPAKKASTSESLKPAASSAATEELKPAASTADEGKGIEAAEEEDTDTDPECRVLTRDELMDFFTSHYSDLPRGVLGSASIHPGGIQKLKELRKQQRLQAKKARQEELRRRMELREKMILAGLGAAVRFGDEKDVLAMEEADNEDEDVEGEEDDDDLLTAQLTGTVDGRPPPLMVGMVGYPNVGKSSTINALLGATASAHSAYRVAVASTPGKTKHFQTLPLTDEVTLVDCPGLVFPSFVSTREEMVVNGVLPIDQLRDYLSPMRLVCSRVPRRVFEDDYGIKLPVPPPPQDPNRQPTPGELLDAFCRARGFMGSVHAGPDFPRGSRVLLKDYTEGKLLFVHPPPGGGWKRWCGPEDSAQAPASSSNGENEEAARSAAAKAAASAIDRSIAGAGSLSTLNSSSSAGKAGKWDNVLLPAVSGKHQQQGSSSSFSASGVVGFSFSSASSSSAPAVATAGQRDDENGEEEEEELADESELAELDEATLKSFGRVVYLQQQPEDDDEDDDEDEGDDEDDDEDDDEAEDEEDDEQQGDGYYGSASSASAAASRPAAGGAGSDNVLTSAAASHAKTKDTLLSAGGGGVGVHVKGRSHHAAATVNRSRAERAGLIATASGGAGAGGAGGARGADDEEGEEDGGTIATGAGTSIRVQPKKKMKKERRIRKGEKAGRRNEDPYGTEAVAEAATRRYNLEEVAAVQRGAMLASGNY